MDWKYKRTDWHRPPVQLEHYDVTLRFFEDCVEGTGRLRCRAREAVREVVLDCDGRKVPYALDRTYAPDEVFTVEVAHVCRPDDQRLEGLYRDVTPPGCPQQYMSQCQQYGFQRILPVIDDCTAKCTFRTVLEGDARYTHLISNGDVVSDTTVGGRRTVVYENRLPMAPYLFLACAGTWDVLSDEVTYPDTGRRIRLEYLVPPGHTDGARVPMAILKRSILFQHEQTGFEYPYETYRTICMEKSLYGGMENTGNTTIITEAALIDDTIPDQRLVYAHGVIPHEFEHSHCGSGVTMETVFDMWLNEAYTVNVERAFLAETFGAAFARMLEREALQTVDVNSGRVVKASVSLPVEENLLAVGEIARQIRLRNLSGIILIDFIDMDTEQERRQVQEAMENAVRDDRVKTVIHGFTRLGLLEMTRKRTSDSLRDALTIPCGACRESGRILAAE
jgi:aminopeptidase N